MISAVIQENEESVGPLADGEVARLLSALHNAEFTRSDKHDLAKNSRFRQRSLIEIAAEAKKRQDAIETDQQSMNSDNDGGFTEGENVAGSQSDSLSEKSLEAVKTNEPAPEQTIRDITSKKRMDDKTPEAEVGVRGLTTNATSISETDEIEQGIRGLTTNSDSISEPGGTEPGIRGLTTNSDSISEPGGTEPGIRGLTTNSDSISGTDGTEPGIRGLTSVPHGEIDGTEKVQVIGESTSSPSELHEETVKNSFKTVNDAFERGKAEGISEGRLAGIAETEERAMADAKAELAETVDTFNNVLDSLARPKAIQVEALSNSINTTILKLASERAGIQIDALPEAFSNRINALVTGIAQELAEGKVHLNEDDYTTMKPYLANLGYEVVVNSNLMRGDVTLQFEGVEVHDVAANRVASYSAVNLNNTAADNTVADNTTADNTVADNTAVASDGNTGPKNVLTSDELLPPPDETES